MDPISEYGHNDGASVTGGYVYRGRALPSRYRGRYFYGDYFSRAWSIALNISATTGEAQASDRTEHTAEFGGDARLGGGISSFGIDAVGELYIVNHQDGVILKIVGPSVAPPTPTAPRIIR